jgi:hypothetical protein
MMLALLLEAALRSLALGGVVWLGLKLLRVRDPRAHMTSWTVVLAASLAMPLIMHWGTLTLPYSAPPSPLAKIVWATAPAPLDAATGAPGLPQPLGPPATTGEAARSDRVADRVTMPATSAQTGGWRDAPGVRWLQADWLILATGLYALIAGILLLRLTIGIVLTWRLVRASRPIADAPGSNVRVCDVVGVPVTFASTILLPPESIEWSPVKRQAVLLHEGSHVAHGDCYVLLLAALNRAVFWFSPFAWWQLARLSELAEMISDDAAIEELADRQSYAHILLDMAGQVRGAPAGLAMARAYTVRQRVERILAATAAPRRTGMRKQVMIATALAPVVALCAGSIARSAPPLVVAAMPAPSELGSLPPGHLPLESGVPAGPQDARRGSYVGYYRLNPWTVIAVTRNGDQLYAQLTGERRLQLLPAGEREFVYKATARITFVADGERRPTELILHQDGNDLHAARLADVPAKDGPRIEIAADALDRHVGWYELAPTFAVAVTREGDRLSLQFSNKNKLEAVALSANEFVTTDGRAFVIFLSGVQGAADELLLHQPSPGVRSARRIDAARAAAIEDNFARWVAAAPDRFRDQAPAQGSREGLLQAIANLQRDEPRYERMSPQLIDGLQRHASELHAMLTALGPLDSIFFRGVGPGGYDIYGAKFASGFAEARLLMGADGRIENMLFRPDGDGTPGGFAACSDEPTLKAASGTAPIRLVLYNSHGSAIRLYELDAAGRRIPFGTIGDEHSAGFQTYVGRPWVVTDAAGQCLELILPGQRTRFVNLRQPGEAQVDLRRATPTPGSEETLRRYIDELSRGEPNYDQMTPEVAAQTRQQLRLNQAILAKLGALRAMSFRGTTVMGNDIYMVHFANGMAEWRIGLVKEGKIGRLALGPQY